MNNQNTIKPGIKQAWEEVLVIHFHLVEKGIDEEGWYSNERNDQWFPIQGDDINLYDFRNNNTEVRPKSLGILKPKDNVLGHMNYDFKNQTETFTPNHNFGKESKVKTVEFMSIDDCKKLVAKGNSCFDWQDALKYHMHKAIDETVVMYSSQFMTHITKLEARNKELEEALAQIPNLVRRGSIGTAAKIAEQALNKK